MTMPTIQSRPLSAHLPDLIEERARTDGLYAIAFALLRLADAQQYALREVLVHLGQKNPPADAIARRGDA
jgi:hypothetical protein